jgi:hypothetical protein
MTNPYSNGYHDEDRRIMQTAALIYPRWDIYQRDFPTTVRQLLNSLDRPQYIEYAQSATDAELIEGFSASPPNGYGMGKTEAEYLERKEALIQRYIEAPCQDLCRQIMDAGHYTSMSNAYNAGLKGVWWTMNGARANALMTECDVFFTRLEDGVTFNLSEDDDMKHPLPELKFNVRPDIQGGVKQLRVLRG